MWSRNVKTSSDECLWNFSLQPKCLGIMLWCRLGLSRSGLGWVSIPTGSQVLLWPPCGPCCYILYSPWATEVCISMTWKPVRDAKSHTPCQWQSVRACCNKIPRWLRCWSIGNSSLESENFQSCPRGCIELKNGPQSICIQIFGTCEYNLNWKKKAFFFFFCKCNSVLEPRLSECNLYLQKGLLRLILVRRHQNSLQNMYTHEGKFGHIKSNGS